MQKLIWRYLVVYKYGGCYLDIDSKFINPIDKFIKKDDEALISAEQNRNYIQWALFFKKEHPILMRTVELIVDNIEKGLYKNDIEKLTVQKFMLSLLRNFY